MSLLIFGRSNSVYNTSVKSCSNKNEKKKAVDDLANKTGLPAETIRQKNTIAAKAVQ